MIRWEKDREIGERVAKMTLRLGWGHVDMKRVFCVRSFGSSARAIARIWGLPRIWQETLNLPAYYILEVISERFDKLSAAEKDKVLIHELMHVPKSFSGALVPHRGRGRRRYLSRERIEHFFGLLTRR